MPVLSRVPITILGAGVAGLSASYHFGHERCVVFERRPGVGGHARSERQFGFTFDQGPHVSFTKHAYVRELFERSTGGELGEFDVRTRNYFRGDWINHPAQVHLGQLPEPLRSRCCREMLELAGCPDSPTPTSPEHQQPVDYRQWLQAAFGSTFAETFPEAYTRKYWTTEAANLTVDWLASRMMRPTREQIEAGMRRGALQSLHYITRVRYPDRGGFQSFLAELARGVRLQPGKEVAAIDLAARRVWFADGDRHDYERLLSTLPLNDFISRCHDVPDSVREAAAALACSQLLLVNVCADHAARIDGHWFYVYDEDKSSTRIHHAERLAAANAPPRHTAIQVEVYFGRDRPFPGRPEDIATKVTRELVEMGFLDEGTLARGQVHVFWRWAPYANVIFTHERRAALHAIFSWLEQFGLRRDADDLEPMTIWDAAAPTGNSRGRLMLAGRFAQWKYFWTDDCVLRGRQLAEADL